MLAWRPGALIVLWEPVVLPYAQQTRVALVLVFAAPPKLRQRMAVASVLEQAVWLKGAVVHGKPKLCNTWPRVNFVSAQAPLPSQACWMQALNPHSRAACVSWPLSCLFRFHHHCFELDH